jgi:hypothetical protein
MGWGGRTFIMKDPAIVDAKDHLRFIITSADDEDNEILHVGLTSCPYGTEASCILKPGDKDCSEIVRFLTRRSTIAYWDARICKVSALLAGMKYKGYKNGPVVPVGLVRRIQDGAATVRGSMNPKALKLLDAELAMRDQPP